MSRLPRYILPGQPQHVIQRGNNRQVIFNADDDYRFYLEKLTEACKKQNVEVLAYVLMTNHVHMLLSPHAENSLGKVMQSLGRYYVQYYNYNYGRTGTLWEGRYKATLLDTENYLLTCYRNIELNPLRANLVEHPSQYPWSSYRCNAVGKDDDLVTPHQLYKALGKNKEEQRAAYRALFKSHISELTLSEIRHATNKEWVLGNERFREQVEKNLNRRAAPMPRGGGRKSKKYKAQYGIRRH